MNNKELLKELEKRMARYGYCDTQTHIRFFIKEYEALTKDEKLIRLKDVIKRIKEFDNGTKLKWTYDILKELESDFASKMYHEGYQQGKFEGSWVGNQLKDADKIRQELNKPVVPQFVAEWYEENKDFFEFNVWDWIAFRDELEKLENKEFTSWINDCEGNPIQILVNMHQFGYEVEKEKRYEVILCNGQSLKTVYRQGNDRLDFEKEYGDLESFTRKQLEEAGFGWVFDCLGIEVREVE